MRFQTCWQTLKIHYEDLLLLLLLLLIYSVLLFKRQFDFMLAAKVFDMFKPFLGEKCLQYSVGEDGDKRRCHYDKGLNHDAIKMYFPEIQQVNYLYVVSGYKSFLVKKGKGLP